MRRVAVVCTVLVLGAAFPVDAAVAGPSLEVTPGMGSCATPFRAIGSGFPAATAVALMLRVERSDSAAEAAPRVEVGSAGMFESTLSADLLTAGCAQETTFLVQAVEVTPAGKLGASLGEPARFTVSSAPAPSDAGNAGLSPRVSLHLAPSFMWLLVTVAVGAGIRSRVRSRRGEAVPPPPESDQTSEPALE